MPNASVISLSLLPRLCLPHACRLLIATNSAVQMPSGAPSVPQPAPVTVSGNELALWSFEGMDQVFSQRCE